MANKFTDINNNSAFCLRRWGFSRHSIYAAQKGSKVALANLRAKAEKSNAVVLLTFENFETSLRADGRSGRNEKNRKRVTSPSRKRAKRARK